MNLTARQLVATAGLLVVTASAQAALRMPQVPVQGTGLQTYLNDQGESIDVHTAQVDAQHWTTTVSNNSTFTMQVELSRNAAGNEIGIYNGGSAAPSLYRLFPTSATYGWFAVASFRSSPTRVVAFEDGTGASPDHDFDDVILFVESPGPLPTTPPVDVVRSSWGSVKARFR